MVFFFYEKIGCYMLHATARFFLWKNWMLPHDFPLRENWNPFSTSFCITCLIYDWKKMLSHFLGEYKRGFYGRSRFIWTPATLGIIIRGYFQFHRSVPSVQRVSLVRIAPHLRALIRDYVKSLVCKSHFAEDHFERIRARWVRLPSLDAVLSKLRECHRIVHSVNALCLTTYESLRDDRVISMDFYNAITHFISLRSAASHSGCRRHALPALPRPSSLPSHGSCFLCGAGLTDKIDWNFIPKCSCDSHGEEDEVCVCSSCLDIFADEWMNVSSSAVYIYLRSMNTAGVPSFFYF